MKNDLNDELALQYMILTIIEKRFSELKYIYEEYNNDNKGTFNMFIINLMHIYRTCIVIDLCKLYVVPKENENDKYKGKSQNVNFYFIINKHKEKLNIVHDDIFELLKSLENQIYLITIERDKELAHKDISTGINIKMHLDFMNEIETLIINAWKILEKLYLITNSAIHIDKHENVTLKKIIEFLKNEKEETENKLFAWIKERNETQK